MLLPVTSLVRALTQRQLSASPALSSSLLCGLWAVRTCVLSLQVWAWPRSRKTAGAAPTNGPRGTRNGSKPAQRTLAQPSELPPTCHLSPSALTRSPLKA